MNIKCDGLVPKTMEQKTKIYEEYLAINERQRKLDAAGKLDADKSMTIQIMVHDLVEHYGGQKKLSTDLTWCDSCEIEMIKEQQNVNIQKD